MLLIENNVMSLNSLINPDRGNLTLCVPPLQWLPTTCAPLYSRISPVESFHSLRSHGWPDSSSRKASFW